jgi:hypothetical protein
VNPTRSRSKSSFGDRSHGTGRPEGEGGSGESGRCNQGQEIAPEGRSAVEGPDQGLTVFVIPEADAGRLGARSESYSYDANGGVRT